MKNIAKRESEKCEKFGQTNSKHHQHLFTFVFVNSYGAVHVTHIQSLFHHLRLRPLSHFFLFSSFSAEWSDMEEVNKKKQKLHRRCIFLCVPFVCLFVIIIIRRCRSRDPRVGSVFSFSYYFPFGGTYYSSIHTPLRTWQLSLSTPSPSPSHWCATETRFRVNIFAVWFIFFSPSFLRRLSVGLVCFSFIYMYIFFARLCGCLCAQFLRAPYTLGSRSYTNIVRRQSLVVRSLLLCYGLLLALNECLFFIVMIIAMVCAVFIKTYIFPKPLASRFCLHFSYIRYTLCAVRTHTVHTRKYAIPFWPCFFQTK